MYHTQGSFFGKTGPMDPARIIPFTPKAVDRFYPNTWCEDDNLRNMHKRVNSTNFDISEIKEKGNDLLGNNKSENL
jgi:hypothetical protein